MLRDRSQRAIHYLRISLTDRCNLRCIYCMPAEGVALVGHRDVLRYEEIEAVVQIVAAQGVRAIRLTGGEPLVRRDAISFVARLAATPGIEEVSLTTNGVLLPALARPLRDAGLRRLNLGIPSLVPETYARLTRGGDLSLARAGLGAALAAGFEPIKINVVVLRGVNDDLRPFLELTCELPVEVRFIEYMPIGPLDGPSHLVTAAELLEQIRSYGPVEAIAPSTGAGPARSSLRLRGTPGRLALIPSVSTHPCATCGRLRLTADGHLRPCLLAEEEIDLRPALRPSVDVARLRELLAAAVAVKPAQRPGLSPKGRRMCQIGG